MSDNAVTRHKRSGQNISSTIPYCLLHINEGRYLSLRNILTLGFPHRIVSGALQKTLNLSSLILLYKNAAVLFLFLFPSISTLLLFLFGEC